MVVGNEGPRPSANSVISACSAASLAAGSQFYDRIGVRPWPHRQGRLGRWWLGTVLQPVPASTYCVQDWIQFREGFGELTVHSRRPHATPSARLVAGRMLRQSDAGLRAGAVGLRRVVVFLFGHRIPAIAGAFYGPRGLRLILNVATALLVLSLPFTAAAAVNATTPTGPETVALASIASVTDDGAGRAATAARGLLAGSRSVVTIAAADVRPVIDYKVEDGDNLGAIAQKYQVDLDDLAFANGIEDESRTLHIGETLQIPPGQGALYTVTAKDTAASVAKRFSVEPS